MLVQNISNAQAAQPARVANDRLAGNGGAIVVADSSNAEPARQAPRQPSSEQLKNAVDDINRVMRQSSRNLEFSVDSDTKKTIVMLVDTETGELIRQIPSEEALAIARSIDQFQQGLLLREKA